MPLKDGNLQNDHYKNLEWRLATTVYPTTTATTAGKVKLTDGLEVRKNGTIYQKGKKLTVGTVIGNGDIDMIVPIEPFVEYERKNSWSRYERKRISVDKLMDIAGYVNENKKRFEHPVILHRDNDWLNFDSDNLEWTDYNDPRYKEYYNRTVDEKNRLGRELNGEKWDYMEKQPRYQHI